MTGRRSKASKMKMKQVDFITVEICVTILKTKVVAKGTSRLVTVQSNRSEESVSNSSLPVSSEIVRKQKVDGFFLKARDLSITLSAPIETLEKPTKKVTCVPPGTTNKQVIYSIDRFILVREEGEVGDKVEDEAGGGVDEVGDKDEYLMSFFTLSRFRKDMMVAALEQFPEEYLVENKSLGPVCKLFCQRKWNSSAWAELGDTETLVWLLKEQTAIKTRVNNGVLSVRLAFGRTRQGQEFEDGNAFDEYTKIFAGESESLLFSKEKNTASPYVRRFEDKKRSKNWH